MAAVFELVLQPFVGGNQVAQKWGVAVSTGSTAQHLADDAGGLCLGIQVDGTCAQDIREPTLVAPSTGGYHGLGAVCCTGRQTHRRDNMRVHL